MKAKDRAIDDSSDRQALKDFSEPFPDSISVIFLLTFIIETVKFIDLSILVVSSENGDSVFVFYFEEKDVK